MRLRKGTPFCQGAACLPMRSASAEVGDLTFHSWTSANHVNTVDLHARVSGRITQNANTPGL